MIFVLKGWCSSSTGKTRVFYCLARTLGALFFLQYLSALQILEQKIANGTRCTVYMQNLVLCLILIVHSLDFTSFLGDIMEIYPWFKH